MKRHIIAGLISFSVLGAAQAQLFRPESISGAVLGGVAGAIIGNNSGSLNHNGWAGAAIGAGTGLLLGSAIGQAPAGYSGYRNYDYGYAPAYGYTPNYGYVRPDYTGTGALLGGIAGAIIGNNNGHRTWQGAAIGAGAGLLLGSIAEQNARQREAYAANAAVQAQAVAPAQPSSQAPVTIINNYYSNTPATPMSGANAMFGR